MLTHTVLVASFAIIAAQDRPLAPPQPQQISCRTGDALGTLYVYGNADFATTDEVDFGLARTSSPVNFANVHYTADVAEDGSVKATISGLAVGMEYRVSARSHHKGYSEGWNEKWSAVASQTATCVAGSGIVSDPTSAFINVESSQGPKTTWIEVFRYRGPGYGTPPAIKDYNLPDFADNHNTGDYLRQLSRWDFPGSSPGENYSEVSYSRYCIEVLDVELQTAVHAVGTGSAVNTSAWSVYLSCNGGKCQCANKFDAFTLESEIQTPRSWVDESCPSGAAYCNCDVAQLTQSAKYTGRWSFSPPFTDDAWMTSDGDPRCGNPQHQYPCHGQAEPKGYFYHHPEAARCPSGAKVGENGCTWRRDPLVHTLSVQELLNAQSIGLGDPSYRVLTVEQEIQSANNGKQAFANVGAMACGSTSPPPTPPAPAPSPTPAPPAPAPSPTPTPPAPTPPTPAPSAPTPESGRCCYGGCSSCNAPGEWCAQSQGNCEGSCSGQWCEVDVRIIV